MGSGRDSPRPIIWTASMVGSTSSKVETEEEGSEEYLVTKIKSMELFFWGGYMCAAASEQLHARPGKFWAWRRGAH